jgi:hypothetical protein
MPNKLLPCHESTPKPPRTHKPSDIFFKVKKKKLKKKIEKKDLDIPLRSLPIKVKKKIIIIKK